VTPNELKAGWLLNAGIFLQVLARFHWPYAGFALSLALYFALMIVSIIVILVGAYFSNLSLKEKKLRGKIPATLAQKKDLCWMLTVMMLICFSFAHLEVSRITQNRSIFFSWTLPVSVCALLIAVIWFETFKNKPR
jgi:hypothetical protein